MTQNSPTSRQILCRRLACVGLIVLAATGCVRRRLTVRSNPPGAACYVDNQQIGTTPCSMDYVYYGTREIRLVAPGYETLTVNQELVPPWYEWPGIDLISEVLVPTRLEDSRTVEFNLPRERIEPVGAVIERAEQLRSQVTPAGAAPPTATRYYPGESAVLPGGG